MVLRSRPRPPKDYKPEFTELGIDRVRSELLTRRWDREKLAAARLWVENKDSHKWASAHKDDVPRTGPKPFRKYALYIATALGVAYACVRIFRMMKYGG